MIKRVVIIGGHIQALGLARQVYERGLEVVLLLDTKWAVARFSSAVSRCLYYYSDNELADQIAKLSLPQRSTLLFPTNDESVEFLSKHFNEYVDIFALGIPDPSLVELFNDKRKAYQYVTTHGIPCPKCWYPDSMSDVEAKADTLEYPVVVKPVDGTGNKGLSICNNENELIAGCKKARGTCLFK